MSAGHLHNPIKLSILAAVLTIALKAGAYFLTGSVGLLSDALESVVNLVAAITALLSLRYAARPADLNHTYGHEKIEFFSSGLEGVLILVAGAGIAWYAVQRLVAPAPLESLGVGTLMAMVASLINLAVARLLIRVGRQHGSIVLEADGRHLLTDVFTSAGVIVGIVLVWITRLEVLDPVIALLVAVNIAWTALDLIRRSFNGLMDHALPEGEQELIRATVRANLPEGTAFHAVRTRQAGTRKFVDFHLLVPGTMSVREAHDLGDRIERAVQVAVPGLEVTIHFEPIEARASWEDHALLAYENVERPPG